MRAYVLKGNPPCEGSVEGVLELVLQTDGKDLLALSLAGRAEAVGAPISRAAQLGAVLVTQDDGMCRKVSGLIRRPTHVLGL